MPRSLILRTVSLGLLFVIVMFSFFVFLEGHNNPGGGFIAGLIAAAMILIQHLSYSHEELEQTFRPVFHRIIGLGLLFAGGSGLIGLFYGDAFLSGYHWSWPLPGGGVFSIPSVVIFDVGVYLIVVGTVVGIFRALEEFRE